MLAIEKQLCDCWDRIDRYVLEVIMDSHEIATTNTEIVPDATLNLEQFLDDGFLQGEAVEEAPITLIGHFSPRGGGYKVLAVDQRAAQ